MIEQAINAVLIFLAILIITLVIGYLGVALLYLVYHIIRNAIERKKNDKVQESQEGVHCLWD